MELIRAAQTIIVEDNGASLHRRVTELEEDKDALQHIVDHGVEDYNLLATDNEKLDSKHDKLKHHCEGLQAELVEARSDAEKHIADLEVKVWSAEAHSIGIAAKGKKHLRDFEGGPIRKLEELCRLYAGNVQTIGGLCSPMPMEEPSAKSLPMLVVGGDIWSF
jgi:hypothetical protein